MLEFPSVAHFTVLALSRIGKPLSKPYRLPATTRRLSNLINDSMEVHLNKKLLSAVATLTIAFAATNASAATVISNSSLSLKPVGSSYVGLFGNLDPDQGKVAGFGYQSFTDNFTFSLPSGVRSGSASGLIGTLGFRLLRTDVDFTSVTLNGKPFNVIFEDLLGADLQLLSATPLTAGLQSLSVSGNSQRFGSYLGKLTFTPAAAAVPEPTTWAFMILGFGMVGGMMRRRTITSIFGERKRQPA
jgi:hypothetical protein